MGIVLVGLGGALGSIVRYLTGVLIKKRFNRVFPVGTFVINITGAFLLGLITGLHVPPGLLLLLGEGFLGGYTTFSTFMYEGFELVRSSKVLNAVIYISTSIITGILAFIAGNFLV